MVVIETSADIFTQLRWWVAGHDEVVEVNERDLIDKILARYSRYFEELLQNTDDAEARLV